MSQIATAVDEVPSGAYQAADWLRGRHSWVDELAARIDGGCEDWLDELAGAVLDCAEQHRAWAAYAAGVPAPADRDGDQAFDRWEAAGPVNTPRGSAFAVMSSGEQRLVRLVATLCPRVRVPWSVDEIGFDHRGAAVLADWLAIVRRQLPDALYPTLR